MISAATGLRLNVIGSSIAMVATGPMPGSTPIRVPSSTPISAYSKWMGVNATPKPRIRLLRMSIASPDQLNAAGHMGNGSVSPFTNTRTENTIRMM
jgi:hypothetical protein